MRDGKYEIKDGRLVKIGTDIAIPEDEPVFVLRAKDKHSVDTLELYAELCQHVSQRHGVAKRVREFKSWQQENSGLVKEPDC